MESILMKIEETAALYPSKEAVVGEGLSYTYEDLLLSAKALASHLVSVNESNKPIALYMPNGKTSRPKTSFGLSASTKKRSITRK